MRSSDKVSAFPSPGVSWVPLDQMLVQMLVQGTKRARVRGLQAVQVALHRGEPSLAGPADMVVIETDGSHEPADSLKATLDGRRTRRYERSATVLGQAQQFHHLQARRLTAPAEIAAHPHAY